MRGSQSYEQKQVSGSAKLSSLGTVTEPGAGIFLWLDYSLHFALPASNLQFGVLSKCPATEYTQYQGDDTVGFNKQTLVKATLENFCDA